MPRWVKAICWKWILNSPSIRIVFHESPSIVWNTKIAWQHPQIHSERCWKSIQYFFCCWSWQGSDKRTWGQNRLESNAATWEVAKSRKPKEDCTHSLFGKCPLCLHAVGLLIRRALHVPHRPQSPGCRWELMEVTLAPTIFSVRCISQLITLCQQRDYREAHRLTCAWKSWRICSFSLVKLFL